MATLLPANLPEWAIRARGPFIFSGLVGLKSRNFISQRHIRGNWMKKRDRYLTMRLNQEERHQLEKVAAVWGCRVTEVLRLSFRMVFLKPELAEDVLGQRDKSPEPKPSAGD
jgi:hypothetical protein